MMIARWHIDARFGHKQTVLDSLKNWRRDVGTQIGWSQDKVRITTGSIGALESTVELEVSIADLKELDASWSKLGSIEAHKQWSKDIEPFIVSATPRWEIYRVV
jgi:hypothetical protein